MSGVAVRESVRGVAWVARSARGAAPVTGWRTHGGRRSGRASLALVVTAVVVAAAAQTAVAAEKVICVNRVSGACTENQPAVGTIGDRLQAAIDVAEANPGTDSILLGGGDYERVQGFSYNAGNGTLVVQGTGAANVTLRNPSTTTSGATFSGTISSGVVVVRELTVVAPPGQNAVGLELMTENSRVVDVRVTGPTPLAGTPDGISGRGLSVEGVTIDGVYDGIIGFGALLNVERTTVDARSDAVRSNAGTTTLRRVTARTSGSNSSAFVQRGGAATVENAVLDAYAPDPAVNNQAVGSVCEASASAATTLRYVTLRSATAFGAYASCAEPGRTATLSVRDSILAPGTVLRTSGANATATISDARWDGSGVGAIGAGTGLRTDPPQFAGSSDLRLQPSSPLIDAGTTVGSLLAEPYVGGDVLGGPRVLDGNGDGVAAPDLGAFEHVFVPVPPGGGGPGGGGAPDGGAPGGGGGVPSDGAVPAYAGATVRAGRLRLDRRRRVRVTVSCPTAAVTRCRGALTLTRTTGKSRKRRTTTLGRATVSIAAGRRVGVPVTLAARAASGIPARGLAVTARTRTRDARTGATDRIRAATVRLLPRRR